MKSSVEDDEKPVVKTVNPPEVVHGHIATRRGDMLLKHCRECTKLIEAKMPKLKRHYKGFHVGKDPRFLSPDDVVKFTVYLNFMKYLVDRSTVL